MFDKANVKLEVTLGSVGKVPIGDVFEFTVDVDLNQPDMCSLVLVNIKGSYSAKVKNSDSLEIKGGGKTIFKGEVLGVEPTFDYGQPSRVHIRGLNAMHKLTRGRKSTTFEKMSDKQIAEKICQAHSLSANFKKPPTEIKHDHVYQHNQTDLQFLRQRAARLDCELLCEDTTLYFTQRSTSVDAAIAKLKLGDGTLERFKPRISSANQVKKVTVRGWDPVKRKEIIGKYEASPDYGGTAGPSEAMGNTETVETDRPVYSQEEADSLAKSLLREKQMSYVTGEAMTQGIPGLRPNTCLNLELGDSKFDGKYYIASVRHRFVHSVAGIGGLAHREAGYRTLLRVMRDAQSG